MNWRISSIVMLSCSSGPGRSPTTTSAPSASTYDAAVADTAVIVTTPGCKRVRQTHVYHCSGVPPRDGESNSSPATACDECLANSDCNARPGGQCVQVGDQMCTGPARQVCKYPDPACGNQICPEQEVAPPPSAAPPRE